MAYQIGASTSNKSEQQPDFQHFPSHYVPESQKDKKWIFQFIKAMYYQWRTTPAYFFGSDRTQMLDNRRYSRGQQDHDLYKKLLDCDSDNTYLNLDWRIVHIAQKFVDVILGNMDNMGLKPSVEAHDKVSVEEKKSKEYRMKAEIKLKDQFEELDNAMGKGKQREEMMSQMPETEEEVELHMQLNYKLSAEIYLEKGIDKMFKLNEFDEVGLQIKEDLVIDGVGCSRTDIDDEGRIMTRRCDPLNLITSLSRQRNLGDIKYIGEIMLMPVYEIRRRSKEAISETELEKIAKQYAGKFDNPMEIAQYYDYNTTGGYMTYDNWLVPVLDAQFKTIDKISRRKVKRADGVEVMLKEDEINGQEGKDYSEFIQNVYQGKWILGSNTIFEHGKKYDQARDRNNLSMTDFDFVAHIPYLQDATIVSIMERMIPFLNQIQINWLKLQNLIAKARPKGIVVNVAGLENITLGDGNTVNPMKIIEIYDKTGNYIYRGTDDEGNATPPPIMELENGLARDVFQLVNIINFMIEMIRQTTGINEITDATTPNPKQGLGTANLAVGASLNAMKRVMSSWRYIYLNTAKKTMNSIQEILKYNKDAGEYYRFGDMLENLADMSDEMGWRDYGLFVEEEPTEEDKAFLEANIQVALSRRSTSGAGGIELEDAIAIRRIKNIKLAEQMLILRNKKRKAEDKREAEQNSRMNAEIQQQTADQANQLEMKKMEMETKKELLIIQAKGEEERKTEEVQFQNRKSLENIRGDKKIEQEIVKGGE